ncbi:hypothetical protein VTL71DRAFT_8020 [Oculimacula yallundae]|uniref:Uncharacterized protein n=1 Tax=Oculimacula yallundae TaxID=86028 RepID=A0ABR4CWL7_9HELO
MTQTTGLSSNMLLSVTHNSNRFAEPRGPRPQTSRPRLQSVPFSPNNVASDPSALRISHESTQLLQPRSVTETHNMAPTLNNASFASILEKPATPPSKAKNQALSTPINSRSSRRIKKQTERGAELEASKAKKVPTLPVTPSSSVKQVSMSETSPEKIDDGDTNSKSDRARSSSSSPGKIMLRFPSKTVLRVFRSGSSQTPSLSPTPSEEIEVIEPDSEPVKGKATTRTRSGAIQKPSSKRTRAPPPASMFVKKRSDTSEGTAVNDGTQSEPATPAKRRASKRIQQSSSLSSLETLKDEPVDTPPVESPPAPEEAPVSKAPAVQKASKAAPKPAPAPKKRGGKRTAPSALDNESPPRPAKIQKRSSSDSKPVVLPEPVVAVVERTADETEVTAWLFAYGKEGSEKYLREKFPGCSFEGYGYGKLNNYEFILHHDAYAKATPNKGSEIYGSIWKVCEKIRSTFETKASKHGMQYIHMPNIQPVRKDPNYEPTFWNVPLINHDVPLKCWMGVCDTLDGSEELGKVVAEVDFFKRRGLSRVIMEMEFGGVPQSYFDRFTRMWVPRPRNAFDTGYYNDPKRDKPKKMVVAP